jgi:NAD(P)-dependent dehydrogenase (short-subunit alcohol dehydrogenase family)
VRIEIWRKNNRRRTVCDMEFLSGRPGNFGPCMKSLTEKVVIVTGASSGIGKALVSEALGRGANVAGCGRNLARLQEAFSGADPSRLLLVEADVTDPAACNSFIQRVTERFGRIDILINNAGISMRALFAEASVDVLRELMDINFWGAVQCTKAALSAILERKGTIIGVSSIAGYRGLPGRTGYSASKFALQGFLEALRTELLHSGAHVMWVSPGFTASNIRNVARAADGGIQGETPLDEGKLMSAEECAIRIYDAAAARKRTVVMTRQGKLTVWLNKLLPGLADTLVYNHFKKEPGSPLK